MSNAERYYPISLPDISQITSLFADQTRAAICGALMSGTAWTVGELAAFTKVSMANASEQVNKLVAGGILKEQRQGRHRYLMIASTEVAELIETLGHMSSAKLRSPHSLNARRANQDFYQGRTCYKHLAGELGVSLLRQLRINEYLTNNFQLSKKGVELLKSWGIKNPQRLKGEPCMDTTHRVFHLAGTLGSALCQQMLAAAWLSRNKETRCVRITKDGQQKLLQANIHIA